MAAAAPQPAVSLRRDLNLFDATALVVGTIIGSGIFLIPSSIAAQLHSLWAVMLVWVVGGALTICGALSLAELGAMYPGAGGMCTYLGEAYGPLPAFLYAWGLLLLIHAGSIAAVSLGFGIYGAQVLGLGAGAARWLGAGCIAALTAINCLGIRSGKLTQNLVAVAKIGGLLGMVLLLLAFGRHPFAWRALAPGASSALTASGFGIALVAVLWGYEGWHVISFAAGEMKQPERILPRSLYLGTGLVAFIYISANLAYYHVLSPGEIQGSNAVAALALGRLFGPAAARVLSALILVSTLGCVNGLVLTGPRVYYAMAKDKLFPPPFARLHPRYRTPVTALLVQGAWTIALCLSGSYQQLFTDVIFTAWIFYGLAAAAVPVLRRRHPERPRPFRMPGYPWLSLLFVAAAAGLALNTIRASPAHAAMGLGLLATGLPVFYWLRRRAAAEGCAGSPGLG